MTAHESPKPHLHAENTVISACREWLDIICFRRISETRMSPSLKPLVISAAVAERLEDSADPNHPEVVIRGTVRHSRLAGGVKFEWRTTLTDSPAFRMLGRSVGFGFVEYVGIKTHFMLERSADGVLWVRICTSKGEPTSQRYSGRRGKMKPRTVDMTMHKY
ncbi:MAG: hypothetical protein KBC02_01010 [Candidatus Pacebacteria bacterium]|nr:hypothetical protein [Candidatus Paceibacterota bacterium]